MVKKTIIILLAGLASLILLSCKKMGLEPISTIYENTWNTETKICFVGDTGMATEGQYAVAEAMRQDGCDHVRILGDVIYDDGLKNADDPQFFEKFYNPYRDLLEEEVPFYLVMGNHDFTFERQPWLDVAPRYETVVFPNMFYAEIWGDVCFFSIDTNYYLINQGKWLDNAYAELEGMCKLSFALGHHPYKSVGKHGDAGHFLSTFFQDHVIGRVDAYLAGHDHNLSFEGTEDGTHIFVSGAGAKLRDLKKQSKEGDFAVSKLGYVAVTVNRDAGEVSANYEFRVLTDGALETAFEGELQGQGIRRLSR